MTKSPVRIPICMGPRNCTLVDLVYEKGDRFPEGGSINIKKSKFTNMLIAWNKIHFLGVEILRKWGWGLKIN